MTRIAGDSTVLASNPPGVDVAFYYTTGDYAATQADVAARHPGKIVLGIDVNGTDPTAAVRDWETGDKSGSLEQWVTDHNQASGVKDACVYCNRSTITEVRQLTGSQVLGVDYFLWVATLDGTLYTGPGVVACQVATIGGYDLDVIYDDGWHPSPSSVAHLKGNILEFAAALDSSLGQLVANARLLGILGALLADCGAPGRDGGDGDHAGPAVSHRGLGTRLPAQVPDRGGPGQPAGPGGPRLPRAVRGHPAPACDRQSAARKVRQPERPSVSLKPRGLSSSPLRAVRGQTARALISGREHRSLVPPDRCGPSSLARPHDRGHQLQVAARPLLLLRIKLVPPAQLTHQQRGECRRRHLEQRSTA